MSEARLEILGLRTAFDTPQGRIHPVDDVSLRLEPGRTLGLVGESGCGKTLTALSVLRLVPEPGRVVAGRVLYQGMDLLALDDEALRRIRGRHIAMVFQDPMSALNPVFTVGEQIAEGLRLHQGLDRPGARRRAAELLGSVGISDPERRALAYPHQLSGGLRQRVMLAMALSGDPGILLADEPTTAVDVTVQAQLLELLGRLQRERGMAVLLVTHDLGVVSEVADAVAIMYAGRVVEQGPVAQVFAAPAHPYTAGLLRSIPGWTGEALPPPIEGTVPPLFALPSGCRFRTRCPRAAAPCAELEPVLSGTEGGHRVACHDPEAASGVRSAS